MSDSFLQSQLFHKIDFSATALPAREYENCTFRECNFASCNLNGIQFTDCSFTACNLSLALLNKAALRNALFTDCKALGLQFQTCNPFLFSAIFVHCNLNLSSFFGLSLAKTKFQECSLQEVDFTKSDLSAAVFSQCDLSRAQFNDTNLQKADLRTAYGFDIDAELNKLKGAHFSRQNLHGLLGKYQIRIED